jgi:CRISPR-associated exonuclease Cas4
MTETPTRTDNGIPISSVIQAYRCPRRFYFSRKDQIEPSGRYIICKQVSLCKNPQPDEDTLWDEISLIDPSVKPEMREYLSQCLASTAHTPLPAWTDCDLPVHSERYALYGLIDKYDAESKMISVVRNSGAPAFGCWSDDRVRIAAYLLCLKESIGLDCAGGYIEYIPDGIVRYCEPQPRDRRGLLQALRMAQKVLKGDLPEKPIRAPCKNCTYQSQCNPDKPKTLSSILFKKG